MCSLDAVVLPSMNTASLPTFSVEQVGRSTAAQANSFEVFSLPGHHKLEDIDLWFQQYPAGNDLIGEVEQRYTCILCEYII